MSEEDMARGKGVISSAGVVIYRRRGGAVEVLVAERQNEPWRGYTALVFGGLVDEEQEEYVWQAADREGREETGRTVKFAIKRLVGIYGPRIYFHELTRTDSSELVAIKTPTPISDKHFVMVVYAAEALSGTPTENAEMRKFRFVTPLTLAEERCSLAFGDALVLADFSHKILHHPSWANPKMASWIATPRD